MATYMLKNQNGEYAHKDSRGSHDGKTTFLIEEAWSTDDFHTAWEFNQNFSDAWDIVGQARVEYCACGAFVTEDHSVTDSSYL